MDGRTGTGEDNEKKNLAKIYKGQNHDHPYRRDTGYRRRDHMSEN